RIAQGEKALNVPLADVLHVGIDINGKVKKVGDEHARFVFRLVIPRLQHVQPFDDHNIGLIDYLELVRHDIVVQVRIHRCPHCGKSGFHGGGKLDQGTQIITLWKTFAAHKAAFLQDTIRVEEAVSGD